MRLEKTFLIMTKYDQQKDICSANLDLEANLHSNPVIAYFSSKTMIRNIEDLKIFFMLGKI